MGWMVNATLRPIYLPPSPGKTQYTLYRRLGGPQGRAGRVRKISPSPGFEPRSVQSGASRYTDWAIGEYPPPNTTVYLNKRSKAVDSSWNMMAHGDTWEGKWRGNWRMQWVASTLHTTSEHGVSSITTADGYTSAASSRLNWRPPADLNGLVRFAERRNVVSPRAPSHFNWPVPHSQIKSYAITTFFNKGIVPQLLSWTMEM